MTHSRFIGARLTEAREARGYNRAQLAEALGITRQAVSQYEKGDRSPNSQILHDAALFLRFPIHRFSRPIPSATPSVVFFRSLAAATKLSRTRAKRRLDWIQDDVCGLLRKYVEFPVVNFPSTSVPENPTQLQHRDIERIATQTRRYWGLGDGPIADVTLLLENNGAIVVRQQLGAAKMDAFSRWNPDQEAPYVVVGADKECAVRTRFNVAHELGHLLLHRHLHSDFVVQSGMHRLLEKQAHYFASAFLLPAETFGVEAEHASLQTLVSLKLHWRVSIAAMVMRLRNLGVISEAEKARLLTYRSQQGWTSREPYDDLLEPERPRFIQRAFDLLLREGIETSASLESSLAMYAADIENATGLEPGFLADEVSHIKFPKLQRS